MRRAFILVAACATLAALSVAQSVHLSVTEATLLSGGLTDCPTPTASSCEAGIASALALMRSRAALGEQHLFIPEFDRQTPFVQMHPLGWGVNALIFDRFGISTYTCRPSLMTTGRDLEPMVNGTARPLLSNVEMGPTNPWQAYLKTFIVDPATGLAIVHVSNSDQPNSVDTVIAVAQTIVAARRNPATRAVVLMYEDRPSPRAFLASLAAFIATDEHRRMTMPDVLGHMGESIDAPYTANGTWVTGLRTGDSRVASFRVDIASSGGRYSVTAVSASVTYDIEPIAASLQDATYLSHQAYLKTQAVIAAANDPVVGTASTAMPFVRTGSYRMCMAGECPLGSLWTDSLAYAFGDQIAITGSGGIRGPGWAAGPVRISDIWGSLPFANTVCRGQLTGVTIWELFNASLAMATFEGWSTPTGDRLLQNSGLRVTYNTQLGGAGVGAKLISIEVLDRATGAYAPLERLRLYTFAADSFMCAAFSPFSTLIQRRQYPGETYTITDVLMQDNLATYMGSISPFALPTASRLINDTSASAATAAAYDRFVMTRSGCAANTYWVAETYTCTPCRDGYVAPAGGAPQCEPAPIEDSTSPVVLATVLPIVALLAAAIVVALILRQRSLSANVRDLENAPREGRITLMFTDIEDSTKLWSTCPLSMSVALDTHHAVIRSAMKRNGAYEVKNAGDSFMIAVQTEDAAIRLAMDIQRDMLAADYPAAINEVYAAQTEDDLFAIEDEPKAIAERKSQVWHGLRVRIGMHSGEPAVTFDEVMKGYDYYGPAVNVAARTEGITRGGQVCITASSAAFASPMADVVKRDVGFHEMKGVSEPVAVVEVLPSELAGRNFNMEASMRGVSGAFDENTSVQDDTAVDETVEANAFYTQALLRGIPPKEKAGIVRKILKSWRIEPKPGAIEEETVLALSKRVSKAVERERRKAERAAALNSSGRSSSSRYMMRRTSTAAGPGIGADSKTPRQDAKSPRGASTKATPSMAPLPGQHSEPEEEEEQTPQQPAETQQ